MSYVFASLPVFLDFGEVAVKRVCPDCRKGASANRFGKPGRCTACIDARFRLLGWEPLEPHLDSGTGRLCMCIKCGSVEKFSYHEVRNSPSRYCFSCSCRLAHEQGMTTDPDRWNLSKLQAARMLLTDGFVVRNGVGEVMDVHYLAARLEHVWSLVALECVKCGSEMRRSVSMLLASARERAEPVPCFVCISSSLGVVQDEIFEANGLRRDHSGYTKYGERVKAHCLECGAERFISATELERGVAHCLSCMTPLDPDAPHYVYLAHFPLLRAFKIGITNSEARLDRVATHEAHGGVAVEIHEVPNKQAARTVEEHVLGLVRGFPSGCTSRDFPQGGYTETWADDAVAVNLHGIVADLRKRQAPGFDRIAHLKSYFRENPATIDEVRGFVRIEVQEFDGVEVQCMGLSKPLEQVWGKRAIQN